MGAVLYRVRCLLRSRWRSSVLLGASVAVVGAIVLTFVAGAARTATAPDRYERAEGLRYDTAMEQESGPPLTDDIAALPSVESVTAATFFFGGLIPLGAEDPVEAIAFVGDPRGIGTQVLDGRLPAEDAPDEFVATRLWTEVAGAEIGDRFQLVTITEAAALANGFDAEPDGPSLEATLVGVVGGAAELQDEFPLAVFPLRLLEEGPIGLSATQSLVALADGADLAQLRTELDDLPDGDLLSLVPVDLVPQDFRRAVSTQANALLVIALITGVAGLVIVTQLAVRLVRQSDDQRQSLSALGLTRAQVLTDTLGRIAVPAVVGGFGAVGLAVLASGSFPRGFVARVEPDPGIDVDPWIHGPAVVLLAAGLLVVVGLVLVVGSRGRPSRPSSVADRLAGRLGTAWAAMGLRFAFARRARDAGSVSTPIAGLVALLAALVAAGTFSASLDDLLDDPDRQGLTFDLAAGQGGRTRVAEDVQVAILEDPDVEGLTLLGNTSVSVGEEAIDVTGYEPVRGEFVVTVLEGRAPWRTTRSSSVARPPRISAWRSATRSPPRPRAESVACG